MTVKMGIVMDPIEGLTYYKDSTMAMLDEATKRGWETYYFTPADLSILDGTPYGSATPVKARPKPEWFQIDTPRPIPLADLDVILMRKDPPFDINYIFTTQILSLAEHFGVKVINSPQSLRDFNEKLFISYFPQCCTPSLVSFQRDAIEDFWKEHGTIILKPLDGMGGQGIFKLLPESDNFNVIVDILTHNEERPIMAQRFISAISEGDKRILLVNGEPIPFALARIPRADETRGNLAAGGKGISRPLTERDQWICQQVGPTLKQSGLTFVGIDVIGDYLTEINVTSPTCIKELDEQNQINISQQLMDSIEKMLN